MKIKQYRPQMDELRTEGKTIRKIAKTVILKHDQVKESTSREFERNI